MSDPIALPAFPAPTRPRRDPAATRRRWVDRLARFQSAGQTVAQFCAAEGVSVPAFYQWKRTLVADGGDAVATHPAPVPTVVPIRLAPSPAAPIELALPSGAVVRFPADACPELLVAVLRGLGERPC